MNLKRSLLSMCAAALFGSAFPGIPPATADLASSVWLQSGGQGPNYDSSNFRGKSFLSAPAGLIVEVCAFALAAGTSAAVALKSTPTSAAVLLQVTIQVMRPQEFNCASVRREFLGPSLFVYKVAGDAAIGYDGVKPSDSWSSDDGGATWNSDPGAGRRGYRIGYADGSKWWVEKGGGGPNFDASSHRGKLLVNVPPGSIEAVCMFAQLKYSKAVVGARETPQGPDLFTAEITATAGNAWSCVGVSEGWGLETLFLYKVSGTAAIGHTGSGDPAASDSWFSDNGGASWSQDPWAGRRGFKVLLSVDCQTDTDWDGLDNCRELLQGTDPRRPDTDEDGLDDYLESRWWPRRNDVFCNPNRTVCSLPAPLLRDVYVEIDWMPGQKPTWNTLARVFQAYALHGVYVHWDAGELGGGTEVPNLDPATWAQIMAEYRQEHFLNPGGDRNRDRIYHYAVAGCKNTQPDAAGSGSTPGDVLALWMCTIRSPWPGDDNDGRVAHVLMHELGHNVLGRWVFDVPECGPDVVAMTHNPKLGHFSQPGRSCGDQDADVDYFAHSGDGNDAMCECTPGACSCPHDTVLDFAPATWDAIRLDMFLLGQGYQNACGTLGIDLQVPALHVPRVASVGAPPCDVHLDRVKPYVL